MNKTTKIIITIILIFTTSLIITAISDASSTKRPGTIGVVIAFALLAVLITIWRKEKDNSETITKKKDKSDKTTKSKSQSLEAKEVALNVGKSAVSTIFKYSVFSLIFGGILFLLIRKYESKENLDNPQIYDTIDSINVVGTTNIIDTVENIRSREIDSISSDISISEIKTYYCIAIFYLKSKQSESKYIGNTTYEQFDYQKITSDVFEMSNISEDDKYKKLDQLQKERGLDSHTFYNVTDRELHIYNSYSEASSEREKILNINTH